LNINLHFPKTYSRRRKLEPCTVSVPFARGTVREPGGCVCCGGVKHPTQCKVLSRWQDHSVKWMRLDFLADLPAGEESDFTFSTEGNTAEPPEPICLTREGPLLKLRSGAFSVEFGGPGAPIFHQITYGGLILQEDCLEGPVLVDSAGVQYTALTGSSGWQVSENGPVRVTAETSGRHKSKTGSLFDFTLRVTVFAGCPWIVLDDTIVNTERKESCGIRELSFAVRRPEGLGNGTSAAASYDPHSYRSRMSSSPEGRKLELAVRAEDLLIQENESSPETYFGTFWADWNDREKGGVCATLYQAYQNFPKALAASGSGIRLFLIPDGNTVFPRGVAKTHRLFLHFHGPRETLESLNDRSIRFQMPDIPILKPETYRSAGVMEDVFSEKKDWRVEHRLLQLSDSRGRAFGMLDWGDAPDGGYTAQGRGNGRPVYTNNEYDFPHAEMLFYARNGERRMLDCFLTAVRHWMDVDICHSSDDPIRKGGQITHSAGHVSGIVQLSHEWVEGLLDYYHQTGSGRALQTAAEIGQNILKQLSLKKYSEKGSFNARETGWALRALTALYQETYQDGYLLGAQKIVRQFEEWMQRYGTWLAPYTENTLVRVPFMISVAAGSLMRYDRVCKDEKVKQMIVKAAKDLTEHCMAGDGLFCYKEFPGTRRSSVNTLVLELLADAFELTGDAGFLRCGLVTFRVCITGSAPSGGRKRVCENAVLQEGNGPKGFAQSFYPIVHFYNQISKCPDLFPVEPLPSF